ncbi:MAG: tetratricopeptide repeat protein [Acidimicrobiia bacterium]|nr:tetratricopeptide repeat protein [Acidimicrobiia bacterium]
MKATTTSTDRALLDPYVPRTILGWDPRGPRHRVVEGSLVSADISGFTALSERLATHGREGAEELTVLLNQCFGAMIEIVDAHEGDVLKFGGDALLILFTGSGHTLRAAAACQAMRRLIERNWTTPLVSRVRLGISQGIHSGELGLHLVDAGHQELWVVGPGMTATVRCEGAAGRGEILLSPEAAAELDDTVLGPPSPNGRALADEVILIDLSSPVAPGSGDAHPYIPAWLLEQAEAGQVAEHRVVTVGFIFFGGVDELLRRDGPEALQQRLQQLADVTRDATERHGVYWLASDVYPGGGKIILTAGAPRSTGQDEDAAVRAARTIVDATTELEIRAGVNRGAVFMGDLGSDTRRTFTVMGDAVNLAARLMQKSEAGQMVASKAVIDAVPSTMTTRHLEPFRVKGKSEPIEAALVEAVIDDLTETPLADDTGLPFIGREPELAVLRDLVERVRGGCGSVVDLVGEPGIGKTRLITELLSENDDLPVLRASGGLYSRGSPYRATRHLLRRLAGVSTTTTSVEAGPALEEWVRGLDRELLKWLPLLAVAFDADVPTTPEVDRIGAQNRAQKVREVVGDLLVAALPGASVIVIDDAYWIDEASDKVLAELGLRAAEQPWLIIALRRVDTECFASRTADAEVLHLGELEPHDTRKLTAAAIAAGLGPEPDDIDDLLSRGATNPLFILELVRAGAGDETPDSIEALVTARMDTLAAADRLLLREGAVLGAVIDTELLANVTGDPRLTDPDRWSSLASFLDVDADGALRFQHALYREVAYEGLSFRRRQSLHAAVGSVLETRAGDDWPELSELLSLHFHAARDWGRSWRYSATAGDRARQKYANTAAAVFYHRALSTPKRQWPDRAAVSEVAEALGDVSELAGRFDDADDAITLARRSCDNPEAAVRLLRKEGVIRARQGRYSQALRWYGRGLRQTEAMLEGDERAQAEGDLCIAYSGVRFRQGKPRECLRWAHRAERLAESTGNRPMLAHASYLLMIGYGVLRQPEVAHYRDRSLPLFEAEGDLVGQANVLNNLGVDAKEEGRWTDALELYERSRAAREQTGDVIGAATATNNIAEILSDQGHLDEAEELFRQALSAWRRADYPVGVAVATSYLGRLHARRGQHDEARRMLADALGRFEQINAEYFVLETRIFQLETEVFAGNPYNIEVDADLVERTRAMGDPLLESMVTRIHSWLEHQRGRYDEAEHLAGKAIGQAEEIGSTYEVALSLIMRGMVYRATGRDRGPDHRRARELLESLGVVSLPTISGPG